MRCRSVLCLTACALALGIFSAARAEAQRGGPPPPIDLSTIHLPEGFQIRMYAENVPSARQMALAPDGTVFVGSFGGPGPGGAGGGDKVFAVRDTNGDGRADEVITVFEGMTVPHGVAFLDGALYVGEQNRITRYDDILDHLSDPPE